MWDHFFFFPHWSFLWKLSIWIGATTNDHNIRYSTNHVKNTLRQKKKKIVWLALVKTRMLFEILLVSAMSSVPKTELVKNLSTNSRVRSSTRISLVKGERYVRDCRETRVQSLQDVYALLTIEVFCWYVWAKYFSIFLRNKNELKKWNPENDKKKFESFYTTLKVFFFRHRKRK